MKLFSKFALLAVLLFTIFGCATSGDKSQTRLAPPESFNRHFMRYKELPGEKVIVVAVDPVGRWAYGLDHSRDSVEDAAKNAAIKCDKAREKYKVLTKARIYAINDEVVYYNDQFQ